MPCRIPKCDLRKSGTTRKCSRINPYTLYLSANSKNRYGSFSEVKSEYKARQAKSKEILGDNYDAVMCKLRECLKINEKNNLTYTGNLNVSDINQSVTHLQEHGYVKLPNYRLSTASLKRLSKLWKCIHTLNLKSVSIREGIDINSSASQVYRKIGRDKKYLDFHGLNNGRYEMYSSLLNTLFARHGKTRNKWMQVASKYIETITDEHQDLLKEHDLYLEILDFNRKERAQVTGVSMVVAPPDRVARNQQFHNDYDISMGATPVADFVMIIILLTDVTPDMGPTELYDMDQNELWVSASEGEYDENQPLIQLTGKAGDIFIADARIIHRGSVNNSHTTRTICFINYGIGIFNPETAIYSDPTFMMNDMNYPTKSANPLFYYGEDFSDSDSSDSEDSSDTY